MDLTLDNVLPAPLDSGNDLPSAIWRTCLVLKQGESCKVYAPSGKGKSTFIHILYGLRKDYSGRIFWDGKDITTINEEQWSDLRTNRLSIIFQDLRLFPVLTARENLLLKTDLLNSKEENAIEQYAERLQVSQLLDKQAGLLSYGERQRFAIIRSLLQPFDWLLMDEPFGHLDDFNIRKACELIEEVCRRQKAGMIVTSLGADYYFTYNRQLQL